MTKHGPIGSTKDFQVDKTPPAVTKAIKQRAKTRKKMEQRTIVDVVAEAINPRRRGR